MHFSFPLFPLIGLAALTTLALATSSAKVIGDMNTLRAKAGNFVTHIHDMDLKNMQQDNEAIIDGLDRIATDARAAKSFTSVEADEVLDAARSLDVEMIKLLNEMILNENNIPGFLHSAVAARLRTITAHAKGAGEAVISDCPADKKHEATVVYEAIAAALSSAVKAYSS